MNDAELIDKVARLWIELGGDADGITWCWSDLRDRVADLKEANGRTEVTGEE